MIFMFSQMTTFIRTERIPDFSLIVIILTFASSFVMFVQFGWMWSISIGMKHLLPASVRMNDLWFKLCLLAIVLYQLYNFYLMFDMFSTFSEMIATRNPFAFFFKILSFQRYTIVLLPITMTILFCHCYLFYFSAKTLKSIELNREADVGDYIGYFFLFMFNVVGFWIIQPRVNRIMFGDWTPPNPSLGYAPLDDPNPDFDPAPKKEVYPRGELLKTKNHKAFDHDDDFDGLF